MGVRFSRVDFPLFCTQGSELSFEEGDLLFILDQSDPNWWMARLDDKKGYIPSNYGEYRQWLGHGTNISSLWFCTEVDVPYTFSYVHHMLQWARRTWRFPSLMRQGVAIWPFCRSAWMQECQSTHWTKAGPPPSMQQHRGATLSASTGCWRNPSWRSTGRWCIFSIMNLVILWYSDFMMLKQRGLCPVNHLKK